LGIYHPPENVGAYRIYIQIVALLQLILGSTARIYKPVISELIPEGADQEIKKVYKQVSKWVLSITMLGFLVIALYGNQITSLLFTDAYSGYPAALVILALGTLVNSSFGPEGMTLEAYGNTKIVLLNSLISLFINIGLGFILIPKYGIVGAAIATAVTLSVNGFLGLLEIFFIYKMQPFSLKSFKYLGIGAFTGLLFYGINSWINIEGVLGLSVLVLAMVIVYIALYYLTNSVDEVDREIIARFTKYLRITK
jgi:O-antigen/teichoic acid export membrane protein